MFAYIEVAGKPSMFLAPICFVHLGRRQQAVGFKASGLEKAAGQSCVLGRLREKHSRALGTKSQTPTTLECFQAFARAFMPCFYDGDGFVILHITLLFFRQLLLCAA